MRFHPIRIPTRAAEARPFAIVLLLGLVALLPGPSAAQTPVLDCLDDYGMAFVGGHSAAVANSNLVFLFGGPGGGAVLCGDPVEASVHAITTASLGQAWLSGTSGMLTTTIGLAGPVQSSVGRSFLAGDLIYRFRVVPDDPTSTAPVDIDFVTRTEVLHAQLTTTGLGIASQSFLAEYGVSAFPEPPLFPAWEHQDLAPTTGTVTDVVHTVSVPVNVDRYFVASLSQATNTQGRRLPDGSGTAALSTLWSFEASTDAPATIVWEIESQLGLVPGLDAVPEPALGVTLVPLAAIVGDAARRARRRRCAARRLNRIGHGIAPCGRTRARGT